MHLTRQRQLRLAWVQLVALIILLEQTQHAVAVSLVPQQLLESLNVLRLHGLVDESLIKQVVYDFALVLMHD